MGTASGAKNAAKPPEAFALPVLARDRKCVKIRADAARNSSRIAPQADFLTALGKIPSTAISGDRIL
jgi:hypothetical protein